MDLGHNSLSSLEEIYADLFEKKNQRIVEVATAPQVIEDDFTLSKFADLTKVVSALLKEFDKARTTQKQPFLEGGRQVDATFKRATDPLTSAKKDLKRRMDDYNARKRAEENARREEAERDGVQNEPKHADVAVRGELGSIATIRKVWDFEITGNVDAGRLLPYFSQAHIDQAIRTYIRAGNYELDGVKIYQREETIVR